MYVNRPTFRACLGRTSDPRPAKTRHAPSSIAMRMRRHACEMRRPSDESSR